MRSTMREVYPAIAGERRSTAARLGRVFYGTAPLWMLLGAGLLLPVDCAVSQWFLKGNCPGVLRELLDASEPFGHGMGVIVVLVLVTTLDPARRAMIPRITLASLGAGLAADVVKLLVHRVRPFNFDFHGDVWTTFDGFLPLLGAGSHGQSFPSAHAATAFGMAAVLAWLYPRARGLFFTLAVLIACQRVQSGYHYPSDTLVGASLGMLVSSACLHWGLLPGWLDRFELYRQQAARPTILPFAPREQERPARKAG